MPPYKRPVSRAQARLFGAAAGGLIPGFSPAEARNKLRGVNESRLPARKKEAPMPAPKAATSAQPKPGQQLGQTFSQINNLNRLRALRIRNAAPYMQP